MLEELKKSTYNANIVLSKQYSVNTLIPSGNVCSIDRKSGFVVVVPKVRNFSKLQSIDMIVTDLNGAVTEGSGEPAAETLTFIELFKAFPNVGAIAHTQLPWSTAYAQSGRGIKPYGTLHADYFRGTVPCTRKMTTNEINGNYAAETAKVITEAFAELDYNKIPAVLIHAHGVYTWGKDCDEAVLHAAVLENIAMIAHYTELLQKDGSTGVRMQEDLLAKHFNMNH